MTGQTISRYRIIEQLGSGGMGVVYKAEDTQLDRVVALKFLSGHLVESEEHKQRFLREAKAAASLDHPNICLVHEIGEAEGHLFLVMGYIDGPEVRARIKERPLRLSEALDIAIQAAEGLRAAHERGIVHRDIKSSNLMLTSTGQVKIMDFGLAQLTNGHRLTRTDTIVGTPAYMSPEQAQRQSTDRRTDIWSLGVVLYEMVTGRLPFDGEHEAAVMRAIIDEPHEPVTALRAGVPLELDRFLRKALAKRPSERYQHVDDLLVDLRSLRDNLSASRRTKEHLPRRRQRLAAGAAAMLVMAAGYFFWQALRQPQSLEPLVAVPLSTQPGVQRYPSFAPDGDRIAFTWTGPQQDNQDIYVQQIGVGTPLRLTQDPASDYNPVWSPDGRWIAFLRFGRGGASALILIPSLGGPERKLGEIAVREVFVVAPYLTWCPDSKCLVVTDTPGAGKPPALFVVSRDTGEKRQLTDPRPPTTGDAHPAISPDGRWLVFRRNASGIFSGELYRLQLASDITPAGEPERLTPATLDANFPSWTPDSKEVLFSSKGSLWRAAIRADSPPARLPFVGEDGIMPVVSRPQPGRPSRLVYIRSLDDVNIWRVETPTMGAAASAPPSIAVSSTRLEGMPQISPDGRRVAFFSDRTGVGGIWVSDLNGGNALQLADMKARGTGYPHWSPDGKLIAFHSSAPGQADVYLVSATGGTPRNLTTNPAKDSFPSFSRDGKWIYFTSNRSGGDRIWKMPSTGGEPIVTPYSGTMPLESPDGSHLYYAETVFTPGALWRVPTSGGVPTKVVDSIFLGNYVPLERGVYYIDRSMAEGNMYYIDRAVGETRLMYLDFTSRKSRLVIGNLGDVDTPLTATASGRTLLFSRTDSSVNDVVLVENFR